MAKVKYFTFALAIARLLKIDGMLSRTESITEFQLKVSRTEKELYGELLAEDRRSSDSSGDAAIFCSGQVKGRLNQV